jgi:predicted AAA+ superfamily ATPase
VEAKRRYLEPAIGPVLPRKMVFIDGPRQVGKTTLALSLVGEGADETHPTYFQLG